MPRRALGTVLSNDTGIYEPLQRGDKERCTLPRSCLGRGKQVLALQSHRYDLALDDAGSLVAHVEHGLHMMRADRVGRTLISERAMPKSDQLDVDVRCLRMAGSGLLSATFAEVVPSSPIGSSTEDSFTASFPVVSFPAAALSPGVAPPAAWSLATSTAAAPVLRPLGAETWPSRPALVSSSPRKSKNPS
ncbi:peptidase S51, putative [Babesia ovata]|uniref:Peptidase S51, putative n=1 Tax=Babesia ovata TaxID=189622 RepID=A0A2H6K6N4_9APIC|nr:peptidase S51, putative [Babesia ovata]GBE58664.1 peptidase S51, putative [Babesia ovata]